VDLTAGIPIPASLEPLVRAALRGERAAWPGLARAEARILVAHGMAPLLYAAGVEQLRPEAISAAAAEAVRAQDLASVLDALALEGVVPLLLKGTALAYDIYASPELRPRGDTDLLVTRSEIPAVRRAMTSLGYREAPSSGDEHGLRQTVFSRRDALGFVHVYDVHWAATNRPLFETALSPEEMFASAITLPKLHPSARCPDHVTSLLLACIHRVAHHQDSDRLIWLVDIALLGDRLTEREEEHFWRRAAEHRVVGICERSVALAGDWMSKPGRGGSERWLSAEERGSEEPSRVYLDRELTHGAALAATMRALPWRQRIERLWHLAFPPPSFIRERYGPQPRLAVPWLYVYRWVRGVTKLFRRAAS
jgi:hypothetical protein